MELKIKIKEVKEERRGLSDMEWYAYFAAQLIVEPQVYLDRVGLDLKSVDKFERVGKFRTETIRDATPQERMAWMYLNMVGEDSCPNGSGIGCGPCIFETCIAHSYTRQKAKSILSNKEVILELV